MKILIKKNMINRIVLYIVILCSLTQITYSQNKLFIKYKDSVPQDEILQSHKNKHILLKTLNNSFHSLNIKEVKPLYINNNIVFNNIYIVEFSAPINLNYAEQALKGDGNIDYVQESNLYKIDYAPNDSLYSHQWGAHKINMEEAWEHTKGNPDIIIGVIDTGIDYLHPDLEGQFFVNSAEDLNNNGILDEGDINNIDDDGNGFIDDVIGWDFTNRDGFPFDDSGGDYLDWDNNPMDENGHGTSIAGIISAKMNNKSGIAGLAPDCRIMNLRAFDPSGYGEEDDVAAAVLYAVNNGAKVVNMSFGDDSFSFVLRDVINYAVGKGVVFVGSSGNSSSDLPHYPSSYPSVISVGASTEDDFVAPFSNYGSTLDLVAPGLGILSTEKGGGYELIAGTSASAPFVSAAAALLLSTNDFESGEIKQILKSTVADINESGWDLHSGAGRLDVGKALSLSAPSQIAINSPIQDYTTFEDSVDIYSTVLAPNFSDYSLFYGVGYNPGEWTLLTENNLYQIADEKIAAMFFPDKRDTVYTIRLLVNLKSGRSLEERVNIHFDNTPPELTVINLNPAFYGDKSTILASAYTDDQSIVKMYYRKFGESNYTAVTLDGFATNNKFVKQFHWGFIPKSSAQFGAAYQIYLEAENLAGLKSYFGDESQPIKVTADEERNPIYSKKSDFELPPGRLFKNPVNVTKDNFTEVISNDDANPKFAHIYSFDGEKFVKEDSLIERIPKSAGDFNSNGKTDILSLFVRNGYIDEQIVENTTDFFTYYSDSTGNFWPALAADIDGDSKTEVLAVTNDSLITIWEADNDLNLSLEATLSNYSEIGLFGNSFAAPNIEFTNVIDNGKNEIWLIDLDGDVISYFIDGPDSYSNGIYLKTDFLGEKNNITSGDFNGDGKPELAVMLRSVETLDIAPFNLLLAFNYSDSKFNILYQRAFIDPSIEFNSSFQKSDRAIRFADIDDDSIDELILFAFPYSYIIKNGEIVFYKEGVNADQVFIGDLDADGVTEVGFPLKNKTEFYEFGQSNIPPRPYFLKAVPIDSSTAYLLWNSSNYSVNIYRSDNSEGDFTLIKTTTAESFSDSNLTSDKYYYYKIKMTAADNSESDFSETASIYPHKPVSIGNVKPESQKNIVVNFDNKIKNKIENLEAFTVSPDSAYDIIHPVSGAPVSESGYLLSFADNLPIGKNNLTITGLTDFYGTEINITEPFQFTVNEDIISDKFFIESYDLISSNSVKIKFNLDYDKTSALKTDSYMFNPINKVKSVKEVAGDPKSILLTTEKPIGSIGIEYSVSLKNIYSSAGSGKIEIENGAGSYIVISNFAANLNDLYLYPQPASISKLGKVTFANIPKFIDVYIFNLNGVKINELHGNEGTGGLDWNLKDESGKFVSSGIYLFKIISKNSKNEKLEEKTGKIAVVK